MAAAVSSMEWSEKEYNLKEVFESFGHQLPFLVIVTQGFAGRDDDHEVPTDEVSWIVDIACQMRIVFRDENNKYYTIPESYKGKLIPVDEDGALGEKTTISALVHDRDVTRRRYVLADATQRVSDGAEQAVSAQLGCLELMDVYDERFLVAHVMCSSGTLFEQFVLIPLYLPITMAIALQSKHGHRSYFQAMLGFHQFATQCNRDYTQALSSYSDIMVFSEKPSSGDYEYISVVRVDTSRSKKGSHDGQMTRSLSTASDWPVDYVRRIPVARGIYPEDRLRELKHVLHLGTIPDSVLQKPTPETSAGSSSSTSKSTSASKTQARKLTSSLQSLGKKLTNKKNSNNNKYEASTQPIAVRKTSVKTVKGDPSTLRGQPSGLEVKDHEEQSYESLMELCANEFKLQTLEPASSTEQYVQLNKPPRRPPPSIPKSMDKDPMLSAPSKELITSSDTNLDDTPPPILVPRKGSDSLNNNSNLSKRSKLPPKQTDKSTVAFSDNPAPLSVTESKEIPSDLSGLSIRELGECLDKLGLTQYRDLFEKEQIDGELLVEMTRENFTQDLGMTSLHAIKMDKFVHGWRPKSS